MTTQVLRWIECARREYDVTLESIELIKRVAEKTTIDHHYFNALTGNALLVNLPGAG